MEKLKNIEFDLLFRIDFFEVTGFSEDDHQDDDRFEKEKGELKGKYGFKRYFQRSDGDLEFVRLADFSENHAPYLDYLNDILDKSKFDCCQLEQAIGMFENEQLKAFLSTDTGLCYNSLAHFESVEEILNKGETELFDISTFYGKQRGNTIDLLYSPKSYNIDISKKEGIESFQINKNEFEGGLRKLKSQVTSAFKKLNSELKTISKFESEKDLIDEVFTAKIK